MRVRDPGGQPRDCVQIEMAWFVGHFPEAQGADSGHILTEASAQSALPLQPITAASVHSCWTSVPWPWSRPGEGTRKRNG